MSEYSQKFKFMIIPGDYNIAEIADKCKIGRIVADLETIGKDNRQRGFYLRQMIHTLKELPDYRKICRNSEFMVRINQFNKEHSEKEINEVLKSNPDIIMLPMFRTINEVKEFIKIVNKRAKICLLFETSASIILFDSILEIKGIDEIYIGFNDLALDSGIVFIFDILRGGLIEFISKRCKKNGIKFGFGGVARTDAGLIPGELILASHCFYNSEICFLSSEFNNPLLEMSDYKDKFEYMNRELNKLKAKLDEYSAMSVKELNCLKSELFNKIKTVSGKKNEL